MSNDPIILDCDVEQKCSGKDCVNHGSTFLKVLYVGKSGYFCNRCAKELLDQGLAVKDDTN